MKDHTGNEFRKGSKSWAGPLTYRYQYIYLDFLNRQNCDFRTPNNYLPWPILLTALPDSEFFRICRIISYWLTFNIYLLDNVPIKVIWSNIFFQYLTFYLGHFIANHPYIYIYIWDAESSNRTKRHFGKNELGPDSYVSDNSLSFGPY